VNKEFPWSCLHQASNILPVIHISQTGPSYRASLKACLCSPTTDCYVTRTTSCPLLYCIIYSFVDSDTVSIFLFSLVISHCCPIPSLSQCWPRHAAFQFAEIDLPMVSQRGRHLYESWRMAECQRPDTKSSVRGARCTAKHWINILSSTQVSEIDILDG